MTELFRKKLRLVARLLASGAISAALVVTTAQASPVISGTSDTRQVLAPGANTTLGVTATGGGTLHYQWQRNGIPINGATGDNLAIIDAGFQDSGWYLVDVSDTSGTTRSAAMFVTVAPAVTQVVGWGYNTSHETDIPSGLSEAIAVSASPELAGFGLALKRDGTVVGWGRDFSGQTDIPSGLSGVVGIAAGNENSFALRSDGTVVTWGQASDVPPGLSGIVAISASAHVLALKSDGTVVAWGSNTGGQTNVPAGLTDVVAVAAGALHSVALKRDGTVVAWGYNTEGETNVPVTLKNVVAISASGRHSMALRADGTVVTWGSSYPGQIDPPFPISNGVGISAGAMNSAALIGDGTVTGWGDQSYGQGLPPTTLGGVQSIALGGLFSLALYDPAANTAPVLTASPASLIVTEGQPAVFRPRLSGAAPFTYQWRKGGVPITGATLPALSFPSVLPSDAGTYDVVITNSIGTATTIPATLAVNPLPVITGLSTNRLVLTPGQTLALSVSATGTGPLTYQWIRNGHVIAGAAGNYYSVNAATLTDDGWYLALITDNNGTRRSEPIFVTVAPAVTQMRAWGGNNFYGQTNIPAGLNDVISVSENYGYAMALRRGGTLAAWGSWPVNGFPAGLHEVVGVAAGNNCALALKNDGTLVAWTTNGSLINMPTGLANVVAIAGGGDRFIALKNDGSVVAWLNNASLPLAVPDGLSNVAAVAAGTGYQVALKQDGTVVAWGDNTFGQSNVPAGLTTAVGIASGYGNALALKADGTLVAWGNNSSGQNAVPAGLTGVIGLGTESSGSFALKSDGTIVAWGGSDTPPPNLPAVWKLSAGADFCVALTSAPVINSQPVSSTHAERQMVTFTATPFGAGPYTYQWQKNGVNISGATAATLTISGVRQGDAGAYTVIITNALGSTTSNAAILTVLAPGTVDFNGDGAPDILLENSSTGQRVLWLMGGPNNAYVAQGLDLGFLDPAWHIVGVADFNLDGNPDILLENVGSGQRVLWLMGGPNNAYVAQGLDLGVLDPIWHIVGTADFNGDGAPDILLENSSSGQRVLWLMGGPYNAYVAQGLDLGVLDPTWHITGMADFNGDGAPDILLENTVTGQRVLWLMGGPNNAYVTQGLDLGVLDPIWHIVYLSDFNGDGAPDILLENTSSGQRVLWLMGGPNNAYVTQGLDLGVLNPVWYIAK